MAARRIDRFHVTITEANAVWFGAVLSKVEYQICK